ncbi:MAG: hypothetical protein ABJA67_00415 [Chthonomonadales bacterium]
MAVRRKKIEPTNDFFSLSANGGVPRHMVIDALKNPRLVAEARRVNKCFMCKARETDKTGLCLVCRTYLNDEERVAAQAYYDGVHG